MSSSPSSSSDHPLTPPELTLEQKEDCRRLWEAQTRDHPDVRPERLPSSTGIQANYDDKLTMQHLSRLHHFFLSLLKHANGSRTNAYLKDVRESCLEYYVSLFLENASSSSSSSFSSSSPRLRNGRRVVTLQYDEFMNELNHHEFQGDASMETLRQHSFGAFLYHFPLQALPAINVSMALAVATLWRSQPVPDTQKMHGFLDTCQMIVRFIHATPQLPMADIKTGMVRKFISVKGHVVKARPKRLRVVTADFFCPKCASVIPNVFFDQGRFALPTKCSNSGCRARTFTLLRPTARYTNVQELRLQESQEESTTQAGRTPRQLEVWLTHDLIDSCRPGDIILLACHVDAVNSAVAAGRAGKRAQETSTYKLFLQGHSITTLSESSSSKNTNSNQQRGGSQQNNKGVYTQQQMQNITQLCHADHRCLRLMERRAFPFDLLVRSLCPSIIGHHAVKAGILLCLLGGTPSANPQADRGSTIRSNSHILIVGDPGTGKSQMLNAATQLAARSVYVGGNTASATGLTVTLSKEEGGETGIEAGALVLADQGVACIDELDKCKHLDGLLEAMEQQQVSIAKAGVVASLPARCSVIAAANPKHGSYNMSKSVAENLNMARPILSRFDLVFILRDRADKDQDRLVSSNIMNLYRKQGGNGATDDAQSSAAQLSSQFLEGNPSNNKENQTSEEEMRVPLEKRLAWVASFNEALPAGLVRDYIAYAREFCKPKLTIEAAEILKEYYMNLR